MVARTSRNEATAAPAPINAGAPPIPAKQTGKLGRAPETEATTAGRAPKTEAATEAKPRSAQGLPITPPTPAAPASEELHARIAQAAYYRALERGFEPGQEVEDWLEAEASILDRG